MTLTWRPGREARPVEEPRGDCPECGARDAVHDDFCDVCFAELDEVVRSPLASELEEFQFAGPG
jgi:hypothetical protein